MSYRMRCPGLVLIVAIVVMMVSPASAEGPGALDLIEPRVDRMAFAELLDDLAVTGDERLVLDFMYSDYAAALEELAERIDAEAEAAGRPRVEDALSGKVFLDPSELQELRLAVQGAYAGAWPEADALLAELIEGSRSVIERDDGAWDVAVRAFRRAVYLHPQRRDDRDETYCGHGVDVIELAAAAQAPGAELERLDPRALDGALAAYAVRIDAYLLRHAAADRRGRHELALARIRRDAEARRREEAEAVERWRELYGINERTAGQIAAIAAESLGPEAETRWRQRFEQACFPWLHRRTRPDQVHAWILGRRLGEEVVREAGAVHAGYVRAQARLMDEVASLVLRARLDHGIVLTARMSPGELRDAGVREQYQQLLRNSGERKQLEDETVLALEALLTEGQRDQMRADLAAAVHGRRR